MKKSTKPEINCYLRGEISPTERQSVRQYLY